MDPERPVVVPAGRDSLESIGVPPGARRSDFEGAPLTSPKLVGLWESALQDYFPSAAAAASQSSEGAGAESRDTLQLSKEAVVDTMRDQLDAKLVAYKRDVERKERLAKKSRKGGASSRSRGSAEQKS